MVSASVPSLWLTKAFFETTSQPNFSLCPVCFFLVPSLSLVVIPRACSYKAFEQDSLSQTQPADNSCSIYQWGYYEDVL